MSRVRSQSGATLIELLVAMGIGMLTLLAVLALLDTSVKQSNAVAGRVNATQRGRLAMDQITRQLRSQVCLGATSTTTSIPALAAGTDSDTVRFYADLSDGTRPTELREIAFNAVAMTLTERTWAGVVDANGIYSFPTLTRARRLLDEVTRRSLPDPSVIFRYYAYTAPTVPPAAFVAPTPTVLLPTPLNTTDLARVAKIDIGFTPLPPKARPSPAASVTLQNEVYVRVADPNKPAPSPTCA
jgi:hypothetical protein